MVVVYLSNPGAEDNTFDGISINFRILYHNLWNKGDSGSLLVPTCISIPDFEDTSSDTDADSSPERGVQDDDDVAAASASVDPDIPNIPFPHTVLDLSWLPAPIVGTEKSLLVREEYKDAMTSFKKNNRPVVLTGQPGVGKTLFLIYALVERLVKGLPTIYAPTPGHYFLFRESGAYEFTHAETSLSVLRTEIRTIHSGNVPKGNLSSQDRGWILFDSNARQDTPGFIEEDFTTWKFIVASSPKPTRYKEWAKQAKAFKYVMKPWSWFEICAAMPLQSFESGRQPTIRELWYAYSRFGPTARIVYMFCMNTRVHEEAIHDAVDQCQDASTLFPQGDRGWNDSLSNVLVVVGPATWDGSIDRRIMSGKVATPFIMDIIHQRAQRLLGSSMLTVFNNLLSGPFSRGAAGVIFEDRAHHVLDGVGEHIFPLRSLPVSGASLSQIPYDLSMTSQTFIFENIRQISDNLVPRKYYRPLPSNYAGIDSFALIDGTPTVFQFTVSQNHPVKIKGLQSIARILPSAERYSKKWKLIFVVPTDAEPEFKHQLYQPPCHRPAWEERVEQYVMALSTEQLFPTAGTRQSMDSSSADAKETESRPQANQSSALAGMLDAMPAAALASSSRSKEIIPEDRPQAGPSGTQSEAASVPQSPNATLHRGRSDTVKGKEPVDDTVRATGTVGDAAPGGRSAESAGGAATRTRKRKRATKKSKR